MPATDIRAIRGRRVWDSRGRPTVEVEVTTGLGHVGRAIAPAGASRGRREALDRRDGGPRLGGFDVSGAVAAVNLEIAPALVGMDIVDQAGIDKRVIALDGTEDKSRLGGNAIMATSLAVLHAAAKAADEPLWRYVATATGNTPSVPLPQIQIFGGGAHAGRRVDVQDFMVTVPGASSFDEVMEVTSEIYLAAGSIMRQRDKLSGVSDEGGWWPNFDSNEEALETLVRAIELAGEKPGHRVALALDIAASEFAENGRYHLALDGSVLDRDEMIALLGRWLDAYPILSIEDPLAEDDMIGMQVFTEAYGERVQIVGDDFLVTNAGLVRQAAAAGACNAVLVKVNQAGTVSEAFAAFQAARDAGWGGIVSARSGETEDVSIAHLATGLGANQLKVGAFARSERMAKWNECLRIEEMLGKAAFAGGAAYNKTWWGRQVT